MVHRLPDEGGRRLSAATDSLGAEARSHLLQRMCSGWRGAGQMRFGVLEVETLVFGYYESAAESEHAHRDDLRSCSRGQVFKQVRHLCGHGVARLDRPQDAD